MSRTSLALADPPAGRAPAAIAHALENACQQDDDRLCFALQAARMYVWERDMRTNGVIRYGDPANVLGVDIRSTEDFIGRVHVDDRAVVRSAVEGAMLACEPYELEFRFAQADGSERWVRDIGRRLATPAGDRFVGVSIDVTAEVQARLSAQRLARHDALTGLANRAHLRSRLDEAVAQMRADAPLAVVCIDLNRFKAVNDGYGHAAGDELLRQVADVLRTVAGPGATVARLGGDEFVALLHAGGRTAVERLGAQLAERAQQPFRLADGDVLIGFSVGAAIGPENAIDAETLMQRADIALYRSKSALRGELCVFAPGMDDEAQRRRRLERDLRHALGEGELSLLYQPLVAVVTGEITGVEALLRWSHPELGPISPVEFIPIAEATGLIVPIGAWALRTACEAAVRWPRISLSVNASVVQFRHPAFVAAVTGALAASGLEPKRLEIEVTESVLLEETDNALTTFRRLKSLGVSIAMDDFGTGYSSLSYLSRFDFDKIKIDGSFTRKTETCREAQAIVRAIVNLGQALEMKINAECVETAEQMAFLAREGCDEVQGYLLGRPVDAGQIAARLAGA